MTTLTGQYVALNSSKIPATHEQNEAMQIDGIYVKLLVHGAYYYRRPKLAITRNQFTLHRKYQALSLPLHKSLAPIESILWTAHVISIA